MAEGIYYASPAATILALSALQPIFLFGRQACRGGGVCYHVIIHLKHQEWGESRHLKIEAHLLQPIWTTC
jgi:hypothetical protein